MQGGQPTSLAQRTAPFEHVVTSEREEIRIRMRILIASISLFSFSTLHAICILRCLSKIMIPFQSLSLLNMKTLSKKAYELNLSNTVFFFSETITSSSVFNSVIFWQI